MPQSFTMHAVGYVRCTRSEPTDDNWDAVTASIELDPARFGAEALQGLESFSHVEVIYVFDRVGDEEVVSGARHPRGRKDWPSVGIFAQRGKGRPNRLGATVCKVVALEGATLRVTGLNAIDGTPVIDIKPVMSGFLPRGAFKEPDWAIEIMRDYWIADR